MQTVPVTRQLTLACQKENRLAVTIAALMGCVVPLMVGFVSHALPSVYSLTSPVFWTLALMCAGGCAFSFKSVYQWGVLAFSDRAKAIGFAFLLEGMLVMSGMVELTTIQVLGYVAQGYLVLINAISCGTSLITNSREYSAAMRAERKASAPKKRKAKVA